MRVERHPSTSVYTIGAVFLVYGAGLGLMMTVLSLVGLQGANEDTFSLLPLALTPVLPGVLVGIGWGLMRGNATALKAALLLPLLIVPLGMWTLLNSGRIRGTWASAAELLGLVAVFAWGSILLSAGLLFARWRKKRPSALVAD